MTWLKVEKVGEYRCSDCYATICLDDGELPCYCKHCEGVVEECEDDG